MTDEPLDAVAVTDEPMFGPDPRFWEKYNQFYEFPIGAVAAVCVFVFTVFVVFFFTGLQSKSNTNPVPVISLDGDDDSGLGMAGNGGEKDPLAIGDTPPADIDKLIAPEKLNEVKDDIQKQLNLDDPTSKLVIPDQAAAALSALDKTLADKILGIGQKKGEGDGSGSGAGAAGSGNGGVGSDSTRARGLRWILAFRTRSGQDYLDQIGAMKGVILIPVPPENKKMMMFKDLKNPKPGDYASDTDVGNLSNQIQFSDVRQKSCEAIQEALRLNFTPSAFWAFFPKELEEQLARLEVAHNNKPSEAIKETKFQVIFAGGQARLNVISQKLK